MTKYNKIAIIIIVFLLLRIIGGYFLRVGGYQLMVDLYLPFASDIICYGIIGILLLIGIYKSERQIFFKIVGAVVTIILVATFMYIGIKERGEVIKVQNDEYTVYVSNRNYDYGKDHRIFVKRNLFLAEYQGFYTPDENFETKYSFENNYFTVQIDMVSFIYFDLTE